MKVQYILSVIESAITSIDRAKDTDDISSLVLRLDYLNRVIVEEELPDPIVSSLGEVLSILREKEMEPDWEISSTDIEPIRRRGRPSFDVKEEQLSFLVENDFKVPEISLMLGVSTRTVERRLSSFGISIFTHDFCCFTFNLHNYSQLWMFELNVRIECSDWMFGLNVRIKCSNWMFELDVRIGCSDWMFGLNVRIACPNWLLECLNWKSNVRNESLSWITACLNCMSKCCK